MQSFINQVIIMFFDTNNISADLISVIELQWEKVNDRAGKRPFHTLSFRMVGGATFLLDEQESLYVDESEIVYVPENYDFQKQAEHGKIIAIHFTSNSVMPEKMLKFKPRNPNFFRTEFTKLYEIWNQKQLGFNYESKILFYKIILEIEKEWSRHTPSVANKKLSDAIDYIHLNFSNGDISVSKLANMCNMSDTYFRRLFVAEFGTTPLKYINNLRMTQISELLQANYSSIEDISEQCGFNNVNYFSLFVKKETGMSPMAYRRWLLCDGKT